MEHGKWSPLRPKGSEGQEMGHARSPFSSPIRLRGSPAGEPGQMAISGSAGNAQAVRGSVPFPESAKAAHHDAVLSGSDADRVSPDTGADGAAIGEPASVHAPYRESGDIQ